MRRPSSLLARRLLYASSARRRATASSSSSSLSLSTLLSTSSSSSRLPSSDGGAAGAARSVSIGIGGASAVPPSSSAPPPSAHSNISTLRPPRGRRFRPPPTHQHHRHYRPFFDSTSSLDRRPPGGSSSIIRHHSSSSSSSSSATTNRASNEGRIESGNDDSITIGREDGEECYARALEALRNASQAKKRHEEGLVREQFEAMAKQRERTRRQREEMQRGGKKVDPRLRRLSDVESVENEGGSPKKDRAAGVAVVRTIVKQSRKDMAVRVERFAGGGGDGGDRSGDGTGTGNADETSSSEVDDDDGDEEYWQRVARSRMEEAALRHGHPSALVRLGNEALERANDGDSSTAAQPLIDADRCREWMDESPLDLAAVLDLVVGGNVEGIERSSPPSSSSPPPPFRLALRLYEEAGVRGSAEGWYNLGHVLWDGGGGSTADDAAADGDATTTTTKERAMAAFHEAMGLGDADAMYFVAAQYMAFEEEGGASADGPLLSRTYDLHGPSFVTSLWSKAPISSETVDDVEQGLLPLSSASSVSPSAALRQHGRELLRLAALAHGHGPALHHLALLHNEHGNAEGFARLLSRAADVAGNPDSLFLRGHCRHFGADGHDRDARGALEDFLAAVECGHADAMVSAGAMLHGGVVGDGGTVLVERDQRRAFELYQQAGELGSVEGWRNVVSCYATGQGVPRCLDTARHIATTMLKSDNC